MALSLSKVIALSTIPITLRGDSEKITVTFANAFKSVKERWLYGKQYRKEAINQSTKPIQKLKQRD